MDEAAYFAAKSVSMSRCGGRKPSSLLQAARHNLREIQAELGASGHINAMRTRDNVVLHGPGTAEAVQTRASELLAAAAVDMATKRRDHCQAVEVVFSLPPGTPVDPLAYFRRCLDWVAAAMGLPVLSAVVHLDEAAPHAHVLLLPLAKGVHVGSAPIASAALRELRDRFFAAVAGPAGLKRSGARLAGNAKRQAVRAVIGRCEAMGIPESLGTLWGVLRAAIERDPTQAVQALQIPHEALRNPIGIDPNPIGIAEGAEKDRTLSCVGFAIQKPIESLPELWARVGCRALVKPSKAAFGGRRLGRAREVHRAALKRAALPHACTAGPPAEATGHHVRANTLPPEGAEVRVRDEHAHDTSAWDA